jgi:hypothetical protein
VHRWRWPRWWPWFRRRRLRQGRRASSHEGVQGGQPGVPAAGLQEGGGLLRRDDSVGADTQAAHQSHFFLGNSYDNLYKPSKKGEADNDALLQKAVDQLQQGGRNAVGVERRADKKLGKLSLEYLVAAYGSDKLNDPGKGRARAAEDDSGRPGDPANYFALAKLYEDAGAYDAAEQMLHQGEGGQAGGSAVYMTLAGYYNRQGQFDKTIDALEQRARRSRTTRGLLHDLDLLLGQGVPRLRAEGSREEGLRAEGHPGGRSRAADQAGLRRSARLQGSPPCASRRTWRRTATSSRRSSSRPISCATRRTISASRRRLASAINGDRSIATGRWIQGLSGRA